MLESALKSPKKDIKVLLKCFMNTNYFIVFFVYFKARSEREHSIVLCVCVVFREVHCALRVL